MNYAEDKTRHKPATAADIRFYMTIYDAVSTHLFTRLTSSVASVSCMFLPY